MKIVVLPNDMHLVHNEFDKERCKSGIHEEKNKLALKGWICGMCYPIDLAQHG